MFSSLSEVLRRFIARLRGVVPGEDHPSLTSGSKIPKSSETNRDATPGPAAELIDGDRILAKRAAEAAGRGRGQK